MLNCILTCCSGYVFLLTLVLTVFAGQRIAYGQKTNDIPVTTSDTHIWIEQKFAKGEIPPFSFVYNGKISNNFIKKWEYNSEKINAVEPNSEVFVFTYSDKQSGLAVKCTVTGFTDFPAIEWVLNFTDNSGKTTPVIEKVAAIDYSFISQESGTFMLYHARGSDATRNDFQPIDEALRTGENVHLTPNRGRSSDNTAFPFFNIELPGKHGIMVAVGWTGKWYADILQTSGKSVSLKSGMEKMQLTLFPYEEIRTPRISMLFWKGADRMEGHNKFRRFILANHTRKINGQFAEYPLSGSFDFGDPAPCNEYECLTEEYAIALVKRYQQFNILPEVFWLDAGWYAGCNGLKENGTWWRNVGNWSAEKERFPRGLRPVSEVIHSAGAKFMVWFEPERVRPGTQIEKEHPEWLLKRERNENYLFNLGNKDARIWMTDHISNVIRKEGIDYYRQDFNMDPYPYWSENDKPDRIGISEIKHIEGLYAFWDSLLVRFPNLLIDNCAGGGRRIDLETTSRSAPLWRTDYQYGEPNGYQCHTFGLNFYLPIHGTSIPKTENYNFRSGLGATAVMNWEVTGKNCESIPAIQEKIREYKKLRPYFYGDYYPLTKHNAGEDVWMAYQLNRPEQKDGIIIVFRRGESGHESIQTKLYGLSEMATYALFYEDYGVRINKTGKELMNGLELTIPQKMASLLIHYQCLP